MRHKKDIDSADRISFCDSCGQMSAYFYGQSVKNIERLTYLDFSEKANGNVKWYT